MIDPLAKAVEVVRNAEGALRELMQAAVEAGQYDRVAALALWAEQLSQIGAIEADHAKLPQGSGVESHRSNGALAVKKPHRTKAKRGKSKYPVFKRSGDNLVKIAWSKALKTEYQHQAPKAIVVALVRKMQESRSDDSLITMDGVLPLLMDDQAEVPSYQSYICLAWLRSIGIVEQHGRQGYSIVGDTTAHELIEQGWRQLPVKR